MSTVEKPATISDFWAECDPANDPFHLGWRFVRRDLPDGEVAFDPDPIPLTLEDLLFPEESDHAMHTPEHGADVRHLFLCFEALLTDVPRSRVVEDCRVDLATSPASSRSVPDVRRLPRRRRRPGPPRPCKVGELGARPLLVVEVTSPETRSTDFDRKPDLYYRANVAYLHHRRLALPGRHPA